MAKVRSNAVCNACERGRNCVNGRFCVPLNRYVEYANVPPCEVLNEEFTGTRI